MTNSNEALRAALEFIDNYFQPWGSWKTAWWEGEVSDDAAFSADNALKHVANILRRTSPVAGGGLREGGWFDMADAPIGELIVAQANTGAGGDFWMNPYVVRNEGRLYSKWQYNNGKEWVNWPDECPLARWRPIFPSLNQPAAPVEAAADDHMRIENAECEGMDKGADFCIKTLAEALGVDDWDQADGSETWHGDVAGTIYNVLKAGRVYDDEDGRVARLDAAHPPEPAASTVAPSVEITDAAINVVHEAMNKAGAFDGVGMRREDMFVGQSVKVIRGEYAGRIGVVKQIADRDYPVIQIGAGVWIGKSPADLESVDDDQHKGSSDGQ